MSSNDFYEDSSKTENRELCDNEKFMFESAKRLSIQKEEMAEMLFVNNFDCYVDLQRHSRDVVPAMTKEKFVEIVKNLL